DREPRRRAAHGRHPARRRGPLDRRDLQDHRAARRHREVAPAPRTPGAAQEAPEARRSRPMTETALDDDSIASISDFLDGTLTGARRDEVAAKIESDAGWKQTHDEMVESRKFAAETLSGVQKARAPSTFAQDVTSTINKRSAGRFFGRRTLGDKMPFGVLVVIAVLGIAVIGYLMWASETGSLKPQRDQVEQQHGSGKLLEP